MFGITNSIIALFFIFFIGPLLFYIHSVYEKRREKKLEVLEKYLDSPYVKKLEIFTDIARKAIMVYDKSKGNEHIAMVTLESMRRELTKVSSTLNIPTNTETVQISKALQELRKGL